MLWSTSYLRLCFSLFPAIDCIGMWPKHAPSGTEVENWTEISGSDFWWKDGRFSLYMKNAGTNLGLNFMIGSSFPIWKSLAWPSGPVTMFMANMELSVVYTEQSRSLEFLVSPCLLWKMVTTPVSQEKKYSKWRLHVWGVPQIPVWLWARSNSSAGSHQWPQAPSCSKARCSFLFLTLPARVLGVWQWLVQGCHVFWPHGLPREISAFSLFQAQCLEAG